MKKIIAPALLVFIMILFSSCNQRINQDLNQINPDSVEKIIIALNDSNYRAYGNPQKFRSFCEDSMLIVRDDHFMTSSNAMSNDLARISVFPHDYTFRLFGNTAVISYLFTGYEILNSDTVFRSSRNLRTFSFNNGKWKITANATGTKSANYFKPVAEINQKYYPSYAGVYKVMPGIFDTVFVKAGKLYDKQTGGDVTWDFPINNSEYMTQDNLSRITFGKDSVGAIAYFTVIEPDGQKWRCPKIK